VDWYAWHPDTLRLAKKHGILLLPFLLEGVAADQLQADNLHPVAEAQPHIMKTILQKLKLLLQQAKVKEQVS
jgi:acyl-CoA thioesterase I